MKTSHVIVLLILCLSFSFLYGVHTIYVDGTTTLNQQDGSFGYPFKTIGQAVIFDSTVRENQLVIVRDSIYSESVVIYMTNFGTYSLTIESENGNEHCIIDGSNDNILGFHIIGNTTAPLTIQGFTFENFIHNNEDAGIFLQYMGSVSIIANVFNACHYGICMNSDFGYLPGSAAITGNIFNLASGQLGIYSNQNSVHKQIIGNRFYRLNSDWFAESLQFNDGVHFDGTLLIEDNYIEGSVVCKGIGINQNLIIQNNIFNKGTTLIDTCSSSIIHNQFWGNNGQSYAILFQSPGFEQPMNIEFEDNMISDYLDGIMINRNTDLDLNHNLNLNISHSLFRNCQKAIHIYQHSDQIGSNLISSFHSNIMSHNTVDFKIEDDNGNPSNLFLPIPISYSCFQNGIPANGNNFTIGNGNIAADPNITLGDVNSTQSYYLNWNSNGPSPCIDGGKPLGHNDPPLSGEYGTPPDMGVYPFADQNIPPYVHKTRDYFQLNPDGSSSIVWCSFPVLDDRTYENGRYMNEIGLLLSNYIDPENVTLVSAQSKYGLESNDFRFYNGQWQSGNYRAFAPVGFKVQFSTPYIDSLHISGLYPDAHTTPLALTIPSNPNTVREYWLGWFPEQTQNLMDAFKKHIPGDLTHTYLDYLYEIKTRNWATRRIMPKSGAAWGIPVGHPTLSCGEMVAVKAFSNAPAQMYWNIPSTSRPPVIREKAEIFTYKEKLDYLPVFVELDPQDVPVEVGIMVDGVCKGAAKVDSDTLEINAYLLDDTKSVPEADIEIVFSYGDRGTKLQNSWTVFNPNKMVFEKRKIHLRDIDSYLYFSFKAGEGTPLIPLETELDANYPNPFNPDTHISFTLAKDMHANLSIYNCRGQKVRTLVNGITTTGRHDTAWNGKDDAGRKAASGIYLYRLDTPACKLTKKMVLLK